MRHFILFSFVLVTLTGCATTQTSQNTVSREPQPMDFPIIDAHVHTRFTGKDERTSGIPMTRERFFQDLKDAGVVGAVAHVDDAETTYHDLKAEHVLHCAGIGEKVDAKRVEAGLKSGKYGCIKIYLGYV